MVTRTYSNKVARELFFQEQARIQEGKCFICGNYRLIVDHCHKTDVMRGLLCSWCNSGIGYFKESPRLLLKAVEYLNREAPEQPREEDIVEASRNLPFAVKKKGNQSKVSEFHEPIKADDIILEDLKNNLSIKQSAERLSNLLGLSFNTAKMRVYRKRRALNL